MTIRASIKIEFLAGSDIYDCIREAQELAIKLDIAYVVFPFNGQTINVQQGSDVTQLYNKYLAGDRYVI